MRVVFVVPYFGKLPNYFQMFLDSCATNKSFDWLIFTDDDTKFNYPNNVSRCPMSFDECKKLVQCHFDFRVSLNTPQKLCDYKCAYGYIFEDYLQEYDWWGHCDLDQIFGDLKKFVTDSMLQEYVKIGSLGHLTLYKNNDSVNKLFMSNINGAERFKHVFTTDTGCAFDEWYSGNINEIFINKGQSILLENYGADIESYHTDFILVDFDLKHRRYVYREGRNSIFQRKNGCIYRFYKNKTTLVKEEYPYVHLQKRKMMDKRTANTDCYFIIPNKFIDADRSVETLIKQNAKWKLLNYQYLVVKYQSFKYRVKSKDWNFFNVLR